MNNYRLEWPCGHSQSVDIWGSLVKQRKQAAELEAGPCPVCGADPRQAKKVAPVAAPTAAPQDRTWGTTADQAVKPEIRTNRRRQRCERCGQWVEPGQGYLYYGGDEYESHEPGWRVRCKDQAACDAYASDPVRLYEKGAW